MGIRIPKNQIVQNKYTTGKEYMFVKTYREYQGYYYELNGKTYAGKEFNPSAYELIKIQSDSVNNLLTNPSTYIYGKVSGNKITKTKVTSLPSSTTTNLLDRAGDFFLKFFCQKINQSSIIKEIDEETYISLQKDPLYKTTFIGTYNGKTQSVDEANKQIPNLKDYL